MKKLCISVAVLLGMSFSAVQAADTGTLNFSGNVVDSACSIDPASLTQSVTFPGVLQSALSSLASLGDTSTELTKPFTIKLVDCPADAPLSVKFEGVNSYDGNIHGFKDTNAGLNVAAMIFDQSTGEKVMPNEFVSKGVTVAGVNELKYNVSLTRWRTNTTDVGAGDFSTVVNYTMSYE